VEEEKIIIRKIKKNGHGGGHGGSSWKVAYADFMTAMMAFFLLLWLITMIGPEKQAAVSAYFKHFNLFDRSGTSFVQGATSAKVVDNLTDRKPPKFAADLELSEKLKKDVEEKLNDVKDQVLVDVFAGGVRIELVDKAGSPMFPLGRAEPTLKAREIIKVIAGNVGASNNRIALEGHTDALSYSSSRYTNWELSTERASAARKELEDNGLSPDRIIRVSGHAATEPLIKEDPYDPRNRRISILLYTHDTDPSKDKGVDSQTEAEGQPEVVAHPEIESDAAVMSQPGLTISTGLKSLPVVR
jgi:chemotaxis protein MotB